jgi:hypothetical protein
MEVKMNNINEKQNSKEILDALFVQSCINSEVGKIDFIIFIISLIGCFTLIIPDSYNIDYRIIMGINFLIVLIVSLLQKFCEKKVYMAATIQEYIDQTLYEFERVEKGIEECSLEEIKEVIISKIEKQKQKKYIKKITLTGDNVEHGVKNWYGEIDNKLDRLDVIQMCQSQNTWYDEKNNETYIKVLKIIIALLIINVLIFGKDLILIILSLAGIVEYLVIKYFKYKDFIKITNEIKTLEKYSNKKSEKDTNDLVEIQKKIYIRRKIGYKIPDFIHYMHTTKLHRLFEKIHMKGEYSNGKQNG